MIVGEVTTDLEAVITIVVYGNLDEAARLNAVIDTGFSGYLTLPASVVETLRLTFDGVGTVVLADGSERRVNLYKADVGWGGVRQRWSWMSLRPPH